MIKVTYKRRLSCNNQLFTMHESVLIFFFMSWSFEYVEQAEVIERYETCKVTQQCYQHVIWKH